MTTLRDHLLAALSTHPGTRTFHLHVLLTAPRKSHELYPFATPKPPRAYVQDILVLLSEQPAVPLDAPRVLVSAVEAAVYVIPATSCAVLYVSKVDSTGQGTTPSATALLVRSLLMFYADPKTRPIEAKHLWVHVFARAQAQYLFANSGEWEGKKWLGDTKLCGWWKRCLGRVAEDLDEGRVVKLYYVLPGYTESEAEDALRTPASTSKWEYGHPYTQTEVPLPCPGEMNLGRLIPYFDDDPKSRFLDEIAHTTDAEIRSPQRKKARVVEEEPKVQGEMGKVTADEFWERMSFRQECVAGAVTGFFTVVVSCPGLVLSGVSPLAPQPGQVSAQLNKRILTTLRTGVEFSTAERAIKATETLEGAIRGLCEGIREPSPPPPSLPVPAELDVPRTPPRGRVGLPDVSPNPFAEPVASYLGHIYASVSTSNNNIEEERTQPEARHVTVLAVRRKRKKV